MYATGNGGLEVPGDISETNHALFAGAVISNNGARTHDEIIELPDKDHHRGT